MKSTPPPHEGPGVSPACRYPGGECTCVSGALEGMKLIVCDLCCTRDGRPWTVVGEHALCNACYLFALKATPRAKEPS